MRDTGAPQGKEEKMRIVKLGMISAIALTSAAPVFAQSAEAMAATDLNVRSGPGPQFEVVDVIPGGETAAIQGCLEERRWCKVTYDGNEGWSYSDYLAVNVDEQAVALTTRPAVIEVETLTYENVEQTENDTNTGVAAGATAGALAAAVVGGPIGAVAAAGLVGAVAGGAVIEPTTETITFVKANPVETVYLDGEVVVGAGVPQTVTTYEVPQEGLRYVNINSQTVLVDAETGVIVQVLR